MKQTLFQQMHLVFKLQIIYLFGFPKKSSV